MFLIFYNIYNKKFSSVIIFNFFIIRALNKKGLSIILKKLRLIDAGGGI
jgi:hypothetical protein